MAVVWAKQAGNWTDTTLWAFWNETTQQIEDYGQVPQSGDVVYSNSYIVTFPNNSPISISIGNGTLTNKTNPYTNLTGGYFNYIGQRSNNILTANVESRDNDNYAFMFSAGYNGNVLTINGNIEGVISIVPTNYVTINGNVNGCFLFANANSGMGLTINGNITTSQYALCRKQQYGYFTIFEINGNIELYDNQLIIGGSNNTIRNVVLNGNIHTTSLNPLIGVSIPNGYYLYLNGDFVSENGAVLCTNYSQMRIGANARMQLPDTNGTMIWFSAYPVQADYPIESNVKKDIIYDFGRKVGTYEVIPDYPPESEVMSGVEYAFGEMVGTMDVSVQVGCVTKEDVREGVALLGMGETGTLVVPSADDVREGVVFDNGTIGTLIVQGGGDRLRIADFGYYTNAQSDTYIVDITEADKPKFASAEERILIEMFPTLDLDNIPEMYFDDLFVKYLKYRLIVEYYRTAGINSTFTPSEPTTEIVNYRNVTCEVWLNSANTYLNAWNKKFGLNKPPQKIRL